MAQLYVDEGCSASVVQQLRQLGHDVRTAHEAGQAGQGITDEFGFASVTAVGRAVVACIGDTVSEMCVCQCANGANNERYHP
jgi:hypothetical protein